MSANPRPVPDYPPTRETFSQLFRRVFRVEIERLIADGKFAPKQTAQRAADKAVAEVARKGGAS